MLKRDFHANAKKLMDLKVIAFVAAVVALGIIVLNVFLPVTLA